MGKIISKILEENWRDRYKLEKETAKKFVLWDSLKDSYNGRNPEHRKLMFDPTIWAYAFLKDKQGNPLRLYGFQDKILNDRNRFRSICAANQIGKSLACSALDTLHHAIHVPNACAGIISKSDDQAKFVLGEVKNLMNTANLDFDEIKGDIDNRSELHFKGPRNSNCQIITAPPTTSILGYPFTKINCDEVSFWELRIQGEGINNQVDYYNQVIEPRTNATKNWKNEYFTMGQITVISNPWGQTGLLWNTFEYDDRFNCYQYCWLANPNNTLKEFLYHKKRLPGDKFDSVYGGRFTSNVGGYITREEWERAIIKGVSISMNSNDSIFLGGDFAGRDTTGRDVDDNVMYGFKIIRKEDEPLKIRLCYQNDFGKRTEKGIIYNELKRLNKDYNVVKFAYDRIGVSDSIKDDLMDKMIFSSYQVETLTYSLPEKSKIYNNLKSMFEQGRIEIPEDFYPKLQQQLFGLKFEKTEGGHLKIHHYSEKIHDDHADAFANAVYCASRLIHGEVSLSYITEDSPKETKDYIKRVVCLSCTEDFEYEDDECPFCESKKIADYKTHKLLT